MYNQIPYMMATPSMASVPQSALGATKTLGISSFLGKINWSSLLSNTQKTLNVVNQAIPLYYQVKPVFNNIKTLGKIGKEFTKTDNNMNNSTNLNNNVNNISSSNNTNEINSEFVPKPTFFL